MASCGLMYGALNTLKTTNLGRIARYLYETFGLTSRMITADNEYDTVKDLVEAGVIEVFAIKALANPFGTLTKLSQGYWPQIQNDRIVMCATPPDRMATIGAYLIEGTTTIGELLHADHINKARKIGENIVGQFTDQVETDTGIEEISYGKSAQAHYQHVQDYVTYNLIPTFAMLAIKWVWWTGHEYMGEDEATGQARIGPGVIGKAAVMKVPRVVGNTLHMTANEEVSTNAQTHKTTRKMERRAYFEKHKDQFLKMQDWPAGLKLPEDSVDAWSKLFPDGYIELTHNQGVEQYVKFHQEIARRAQKLVIMPGTEMFVDAKAREPQVALPAIGTPTIGTTTQTAPPRRAPILPPRRPLPTPIRRPAPTPASPQPTLEEQLTKSIEQQTGPPVLLEPAAGDGAEPPSINDLNSTQNKGE